MKIRADFVTNSSSSSFVSIYASSKRLQELLGCISEDELNQKLDQALGFAYDEFDGGELPLVEDERFDYNSVAEYLVFMLENAGEMSGPIDASSLTDADLQSVEIDHAEFDDGSYAPFEYVRINNGKKLTIRVEETYEDDAYKGESIEGMEFYIIGSANEFKDLDGIRRFILASGATITDTLTDKTRYAICPGYTDEADELNHIRDACVPILFEKAFVYRYMDDEPYDDIYDLAHLVGFQEITVRDWFELFGLGDTEIEYWKDGHWVNLEAMS